MDNDEDLAWLDEDDEEDQSIEDWFERDMLPTLPDKDLVEMKEAFCKIKGSQDSTPVETDEDSEPSYEEILKNLPWYKLEVMYEKLLKEIDSRESGGIYE